MSIHRRTALAVLGSATVGFTIGLYILDPHVQGYGATGTATAKSMVFNIVAVHILGMLGTLIFWGANPRMPIGG